VDRVGSVWPHLDNNERGYRDQKRVDEMDWIGEKMGEESRCTLSN